MELEDRELPIFLGMSLRAARRGHVWDLLGVSRLVLFPFFPQHLIGLQCLIGLHRNLLRQGEGFAYRILFTDETKPENQAWIDQNVQIHRPATSSTIAVDGSFSVSPLSIDGGTSSFGWGVIGGPEEEPGSFELVPLPSPPLVLWRPTRVLVDLVIDGRKYRLGDFTCGFVAPAPLLEEERRAIASRPGAYKAIAHKLGCKKCGSEVTLYTMLDPQGTRPKEISTTAIRLDTAPPSWKCECGEQNVDLTYLKQGHHDVFRRTSARKAADLLNYTPLYESGRVEAILGEYERLIESATEEEPVQKFLESQPIFWSFLSPAKILHKPAVLTKKKADFAVLSTHKVLYLVEIEKPTTRLINKDGSVAAEILHGADQIRDWEVVVDNHRLALLSELNLKEGEVQEVRYLLIGGMARRTNADGLVKLRRSPLASKTSFYCFDELSSFLHVFAGELQHL